VGQADDRGPLGSRAALPTTLAARAVYPRSGEEIVTRRVLEARTNQVCTPACGKRARRAGIRIIRVTTGCADNMCGTSEVPQLADPLCATCKSAEVGQVQKSRPFLATSNWSRWSLELPGGRADVP
jgi:hypothetical protein